MTRIFPALRVESRERGEDADTGSMTEWEDAGGCFYIEADAEEYISEKLEERFGVGPFFLMNLTQDPQIWAAIFFTEIIKNSDEVLISRAELCDDIRFAAYGEAKPGMINPPLGAMTVRSASALHAASSRHEVFRKAWEALRSCAPEGKWVAVVDL